MRSRSVKSGRERKLARQARQDPLASASPTVLREILDRLLAEDEITRDQWRRNRESISRLDSPWATKELHRFWVDNAGKQVDPKEALDVLALADAAFPKTFDELIERAKDEMTRDLSDYGFWQMNPYEGAYVKTIEFTMECKRQGEPINPRDPDDMTELMAFFFEQVALGMKQRLRVVGENNPELFDEMRRKKLAQDERRRAEREAELDRKLTKLFGR